MIKMVFVLNEEKILKEDTISLVKLRIFLDEVLNNNAFLKESNENRCLTYKTINNEDNFENLLGVYLQLFKQAWLKECLSDWYILSNEDSKDGSFVREEVLSNKYVRW